MREKMIMCMDKLSLMELYQIQQETQFELQDKEGQVHSQLELLSQDKQRYIEECATLQRERAEFEKASTQLKVEKQEIEQVSAKLREEK